MERRASRRGRTLLGGKVVFNLGRSAIDCVVRNLSEGGCCIEVATPVGIPDNIDLSILGEPHVRPCRVAWRSNRRLGLAFLTARQNEIQSEPQEANAQTPLLTLRSALNEVQFGVLLVDKNLQAEFINRAFREMWRVPDAMAAASPHLEDLIRHGRGARADWSDKRTNEYVSSRLALVKAGSATPVDIPLANGEVVRLNCAVLPNGGRMLTYTYVTDFIRKGDELDVLRAALDHVPEGIILLDSELNAQFMNQSVRRLWHVSDDQADTKPSYEVLVSDARYTGVYGVSPDDLDRFIEARIERIKSADPAPQTLRTSDGRDILAQCSVLPGGGRMLTYWDVSDFVAQAEKLQTIASLDPLTGMFNRRHFLTAAQSEWERFQRYSRPLSALLIDIDKFKDVNDRFGHAVGDEALSHVANTCMNCLRSVDIAARIGGDEFAILLPETDSDQAFKVAERIREGIAKTNMRKSDMTVSIGVAGATLSMSGVEALLRAADVAMYDAKSIGRNKTKVASIDRAVIRFAAE